MERPCLPAFQLTDHVGRVQHGYQVVPILGRRIVPGDQRVRIFAFIYTGSVPSQPQIGMFHFLQLAATNRIARCGTAPRNTEGVAVQEKPFFRTSLPPPTPSQTPKTIGLRPKPQSFALILAYFNYCFMFLKMSVPVIGVVRPCSYPNLGPRQLC